MSRIRVSERRLHTRIDQQLPFKVVANGYDFTTCTKNVSCLGAYCHIDKYVPPFTKVMIKLCLPNGTGREKNKTCDVECKGVIVRVEDEGKSGYNIAIFFNGISDACRQRIEQYVSHLALPQMASLKAA